MCSEEQRGLVDGLGCHRHHTGDTDIASEHSPVRDADAGLGKELLTKAQHAVNTGLDSPINDLGFGPKLDK